MKFRKQNQNGGTKTCIVRDCRSFLDSCNLTNKAYSHIPKVEIHHVQDKKICHFGRFVAKAKLFCQKSFVPVIRVGVLIWVNFQTGNRDLGRKNRDLGNRARPASHMNTSKFLRRKEWRGEITETEPAPDDRVHMKRPSEMEKALCDNYGNECEGCNADETSPLPSPLGKMCALFGENKLITLAYHNWNIWNIQILKRERKCKLGLHC